MAVVLFARLPAAFNHGVVVACSVRLVVYIQEANIVSPSITMHPVAGGHQINQPSGGDCRCQEGPNTKFAETGEPQGFTFAD